MYLTHHIFISLAFSLLLHLLHSLMEQVCLSSIPPLPQSRPEVAVPSGYRRRLWFKSTDLIVVVELGCRNINGTKTES